MRSLSLFAVLALLCVESVLAGPPTTVTKCTATKTAVVTYTTSKTITRTIIIPLVTVTTSIIKTQTVSVSVTITTPATTTVTTTATTTATTTTTTSVTKTATQEVCQPTYANVVPNGGFEHGLDGWIPQGASISTRCSGADWVREGNCGLAVTFPPASSSSPAQSIERSVSLCKGFVFEVRYLARITGTCTMRVSVDGGGATEYFGSAGDEWVATAVAFDPGYDAESTTPEKVLVKVEFQSGSGSGDGCSVSLDAFSLETVRRSEQRKRKREEGAGNAGGVRLLSSVFS